ncbi:MAG TPA: MBL fold metallo-hydrolase [Streptosporangiaceae bacterium]
MRMTKLGHSCVRLEKDGESIVIDPGIWSGEDPLAGASAVLITHEHVDHLDAGLVQAALERDGGLHLWTNAAVASQFTGFGDRVHVVGHGDAFTAAGFDVHVHGQDHACVHPDLPLVPNVCFYIDQNVFHPGDSFTIPDEPVETLLLPISAPWLKASEMFDYARAVRPRVSYAIHDEILNANGVRLVGQLAGMLLGGAGEGGYVRLEPGSGVEL